MALQTEEGLTLLGYLLGYLNPVSPRRHSPLARERMRPEVPTHALISSLPARLAVQIPNTADKIQRVAREM
ncbi:MAG: hypothetical protein Q8R39_00960 [bacterium]|nr:hypothetical protein [bacterium]